MLKEKLQCFVHCSHLSSTFFTEKVLCQKVHFLLTVLSGFNSVPIDCKKTCCSREFQKYFVQKSPSQFHLSLRCIPKLGLVVVEKRQSNLLHFLRESGFLSYPESIVRSEKGISHYYFMRFPIQQRGPPSKRIMAYGFCVLGKNEKGRERE